MHLPEKVRGTLERLVKNIKNNENISAVALFGSWSRGDATSSSDVDLLVIDKSNEKDEYIERQECNGLIIDLDYLPKNFLTRHVSPEIDQKLYEAYILYDRDWTLTTVKNQVAKFYASPERVDVRTEAYLVDADIYFSRAASAITRKDTQSACVFAALAMEEALKIILEVEGLPISNSRFISMLETATQKVNATKELAAYLAVSQIVNETKESVEKRLILFRTILNEISAIVRDNEKIVNSLHYKVKNALKYYVATPFLPGMILRSKGLIDNNMYIECAHYINRTLIHILENYAWLKSTMTGIKIDYTTLFRSLKTLEKTSTLYKNVTEALNLEKITQESAEYYVELARDVVIKIRKQRKEHMAKKFQ